jgi:hypothetical protein
VFGTYSFNNQGVAVNLNFEPRIISQYGMGQLANVTMPSVASGNGVGSINLQQKPNPLRQWASEAINQARSHQGDTNLRQFSEDAIPLNTWVERYKNMSFNDIITQEPNSMGLPGGPSDRYVINPYDGNVMDMRHVMVVGFKTGVGIGSMVENLQYAGPWVGANTRGSAYNAQDYYSNSLGANYYKSIKKFRGMADKMKNFASGFSNWLKTISK